MTTPGLPSIGAPATNALVTAGYTSLDQLAGVLTESAQQHALDLLARRTLQEVLRDGVSAVREAVVAGTAADQRLTDIGIAIVEGAKRGAGIVGKVWSVKTVTAPPAFVAVT